MALTKTSKKHKAWYVQFKDHNGQRRRLRAFEDKRASTMLDARVTRLLDCRISGAAISSDLTDWLRFNLDADRRNKLAEWGLIPRGFIIKPRTLSDLVAAYETYHKQKGTTTKQHNQVMRTVRRWIDETNVTEPADFNPDLISAALYNWQHPQLDERRTKALEIIYQTVNPGEPMPKPKPAKGMSPETRKKYLIVLTAFLDYLVERGYLAENPSSRIAKPKVEADRRRRRRALCVDELRHFLATTKLQPKKGRATGAERALIYRTMAETGLRVSEIRSVRRINLRLDGPNPYIIVEARHTKNRKVAQQPVPLPLALAIRAHIAKHSDREQVFQLCANARRIEIFREDLAAAGLEYEVNGEFVDVHALRVTYITNLGRAGVPLTMAQKLARHSDPKLTANVYSWAGIEEKSAAVNSLPSIA